MHWVSTSHYFLLLSAFLALIADGTCLKCYNCSDYDMRNCYWSDPYYLAEMDQIDCPSGVSCQKVKLPAIGGEKSVARGCYDEKLCTDLSVCFSCEEDLCNGSGALLPSFVLLMLFILYSVHRSLVL